MISEYTTVILTSRDGRTVRFGLRKRWLITFCVLFTAVALAGIAGIVFGWGMLAERESWMNDKRFMFAELDKKRIEIEHLNLRLADVECNAAHDEDGWNRCFVSSSGAESVYQNEIDKGIVRIENPVFRRESRKTLRLAMEMYHTAPPESIGGRVLFSLKTAAGEVYPLTHGDTAFDIMRFKKIVLTADAPPVGIEMAGASVILEVLSAGQLIYRRIYPLLTDFF